MYEELLEGRGGGGGAGGPPNFNISIPILFITNQPSFIKICMKIKIFKFEHEDTSGEVVFHEAILLIKNPMKTVHKNAYENEDLII